MPKATGGVYYYAVAKGRQPGLYHAWGDCEDQVKGFPASKHKKFRVQAEAEAWLRDHGVSQFETTATPPSNVRYSPTRSQAGSSTAVRLRRSASPVRRNQTPAAREEPRNDGLTPRIVYCDGACRGNGKAGSIAGVGVYWGVGDSRNIAERCPGVQTNNRAELIAIIRVLETDPIDFTPLIIRTDSKYSIQCMTAWLPKWRRNDFRTADGKPVSNQGLICYIDALLDERRQAGQKVSFEHVYGHRGDVGNEGADHQANRGCELPALDEDRDWQTLEHQVRARTEEAKKAMEQAEEEAMLEAMGEDSVPAQEQPLVAVEDIAQPEQVPSSSPELPAKQVSEADLMAFADCLATTEELEAEIADF